MRPSFYYIIAVFFSIALGNQVPALAEDSNAQHVSGSGNSQPRKPMPIHISGSGSVTGYQSTITHISGVKKPVPEMAPAIPKVSADKARHPQLSGLYSESARCCARSSPNDAPSRAW